MLTDKQIKARFQKRHIKKLWREMLNSTSEFSKFEDHKTYKVIVSQELVDKFIDSIYVEKIDEKADAVGRITSKWLMHWVWDNGRKHWNCERKIYVRPDRGIVCGYPDRSALETIDWEIRHALSADCLVEDGTAIYISF